MEQITSQLVTFCQQRCTGTFFGVTERNESLVIALKEGSIVGLSLSNVVGATALPLLQAISCQKASFNKKVVMRVDTDLPKTSKILEVLGVVLLDETLLLTSESKKNARLIDGQKVCTIVEDVAKNLFGPVAVLLLKEYFVANDSLTDDELRQRLQAMAEAAGAPQLTKQLIAGVIEKLRF